MTQARPHPSEPVHTPGADAARAPGASLSISVVICVFADERLDDAVLCVESALSQVPPPSEVVVVVDHNADLGDRLRQRLPAEVEVCPNVGAPGLSSARNTAIGLVRGEVIAFLDDDAVAEPGWIAALNKAFSDALTIGVGGRAMPVWDAEQPEWFPEEFLWVVGCSYRGQPEAGEVRNPLGCNMAFRREVFERAGLFDTQIGRLGKRPLGCEETEICIRARRTLPQSRFVLIPGADIRHRVPASRGHPGYFLRRCYYEGISKALVRTLGDTRSLDTERAYVGSALPRAVIRAGGALVFGPDRAGAAGRLVAIVAGLASAGSGYLLGSFFLRVGHRSRGELTLPG